MDVRDPSAGPCREGGEGGLAEYVGTIVPGNFLLLLHWIFILAGPSKSLSSPLISSLCTQASPNQHLCTCAREPQV